jgi:adenosylmethionine-8-amino-7-oxononanoate aminotransferase
MHRLAELDHRYVWHPFTQMRDWLKGEPLVIAAGRGAVLQDVRGREFLDANSSIWTNLHGHNHPTVNAALAKQLKQIAHSSALGLSNVSASLLAEQLVRAANPTWLGASVQQKQDPRRAGTVAERRVSDNPPYLGKVFFSDDGSTAMEVALKLAYEFARRKGGTKQPRFLSLEGAYHGDTVGAVSLGHIDLFHKAYAGLLFRTDKVMAPYCYRCPFNRAKPERADAREYRRCKWECLDKVEQKFSAQKRKGSPYAGFVFEPLIQGPAGMIPQPSGWLSRATEIARGYRALLIADEVMTGFGRTGLSSSHPLRPSITNARLFACHRENVQPDFLVLAKGLTAGYLPMAATLTTQRVFDAFLGDYDEFKTFFHGHSFTGNQLGAAAALANLQILSRPAPTRTRQRLEQTLSQEMKALWSLPNVGDIRQVGLVAGIELVKDWRTREPFQLVERAGIRVCEAMATRGVLTRPIGNVIVLMPPYCTTSQQVKKIVAALGNAIQEVFPSGKVIRFVPPNSVPLRWPRRTPGPRR